MAQRTREFGIRLALGSTARQVFRQVLSEGMVILAVGLALGTAGAYLLRDVPASQLYGIELMDPSVLLAGILLLSAVALLACILPARRATRVDPVSALNCE